jgi:hypothetical protein
MEGGREGRTEGEGGGEDDAGYEEGDDGVGIVSPTVVCEPDEESCSYDSHISQLHHHISLV